MTRRALVVCTANVCRSPSAERLLQRRLDGAVDVDGHEWVVRSAGTSMVSAPVDPNTIRAAKELDLDLTGHTARLLDADTLVIDGRDLVLTMHVRAHLREVVAMDPTAWPRTFTLREIVRRASVIPPPQPGESVPAWLSRVADGRKASELMRADPVDDIDDPYGGPWRQHQEMLAVVDDLTDRLIQVGPWFQRVAGA